MDFYDQDHDESVIDPWGEDGDELDVSMCDCCPPQASGIMTGLAWGVSVMLWIVALTAMAATGQYAAFGATLVTGFAVFIGVLYGWR